jgi:hypothetical protein
VTSACVAERTVAVQLCQCGAVRMAVGKSPLIHCHTLYEFSYGATSAIAKCGRMEVQIAYLLTIRCSAAKPVPAIIICLDVLELISCRNYECVLYLCPIGLNIICCYRPTELCDLYMLKIDVYVLSVLTY